MPMEQVLRERLSISGRMLQRLTRSRGLRRNGRAGHLAARVRAGDVLEVRLADEDPGVPPVAMELAIVHEDEQLLVVDKPPYLLVHPTAPHHTATLAHGVAHHLVSSGSRVRVRPVHRLDRDTSGLVLFAKSAMAQQKLTAQLEDRSLRREYLAVVEGEMEEEEIHIGEPIGRHRSLPHLRAVRSGGEAAVTRVRVVERLGGCTVARVELETGRTHQIRVHLAHVGHPLVGDTPYGGGGMISFRRQALHAARLSCLHPATGAPASWEAPLPADLRELIAALRGRSG